MYYKVLIKKGLSCNLLHFSSMSWDLKITSTLGCTRYIIILYAVDVESVLSSQRKIMLLATFFFVRDQNKIIFNLASLYC